MTRSARRAAVVVLAATLLLGGCASSDGPDDAASDAATASDDAFAASSGGQLPDVRLGALSGDGSLDLRSLRGPAIVNVWASWCVPCKDELPLYQEFAQAHGDQVDVVGITSEDVSEDAARTLVSATGVTYANYTDPDGDLRAIALPQVVLVDASGEIAFEQYLEITSVAQLEDLAREHLGVDL